MKVKRCFLLVQAAILLCLSPTAFSATGPGTITQLSSGDPTDQQNSPAISGTQVVWTNSFTPSTGTSNFDIVFLDLAGGGPAVNITNTPDAQEFLEDIDGTHVVYTRTSTSDPGDIVLYDTALGTSTVIAASSPSLHFQQPSIRGRYVAFLSVSSSQIDVALYDIVLGTTIAVTNDAAVQGRPRLGTDMLVYEDYATGHPRIFGYRISTNGPAIPLTSATDDQITPDTDGNTVVWVQTTASGEQVFALDLTTNIATQLTTVSSNKIQPRISGNRVIWSDDRNGNLDLYMFNLATGIEAPLVVGVGDQFLADIDGDRVVFTSNEAGFEQVFQIVLNTNDFSIAANPTALTLQQGSSGTSSISTAVTAGGAAAVSLAVSGLPSGASAAFNPASVTAGGGSVLTVNAGTAPPGVYMLSVTGTEGPVTHATTVTLTITGPQLSITPTSIDFGTVKRFDLRLAEVTVKNIGTTTVLISNVGVTLGAGADPDDFTPISLCGSSLAPGKSCIILVLFFGDDLGTTSATLIITDNAVGSPQAVALTGTVIKR